jgi:hypothetical protein
MLLWIITILAFAGGLGLAGTMAWLERNPRNDFQPRLVPTTPVMFIGLLIALLAIAHMLALLGIDLPQR